MERAETNTPADTAAKDLVASARRDPDAVMLATILETMDQGVVVIEPDLTVAGSNPRAMELLDIPREMLLPGADFSAVIEHAAARGDYDAEGTPEHLIERFRALASGSEAYRFERIRPDGLVVEIRGNPRPLGGFVITYTDVTERTSSISAVESAHRALEDKKRQIDIALDNMSQGLNLYDANQRLVLCNRRYREIYGLTEEQARPGTTLREIMECSLKIGNYDDAEAGRTALDERLRMAHSRDRQVFHQKLAGGRIVEVIHQPLPDGGSVATFTDVSSQVRGEAELLAAKQQAEIASRAKSEFLANMSHELRTPLNAIIGFSEILRHELMGPLGDPQYRGYAADIHDSGIHLLSVINDILDLSKIEAGKLDLMEEKVDVPRVIAASLRIVKERAEAAGLDIFAELADDLPRLRADARALKQIILNLLSNAIKFTPAGGRISVRAMVDDDGYFNLSVVDNGIGIAPQEIPKAMSPFGQVDSSLARAHEGTGLGLPLVKSLAEMHDGELAIESEIGAGTEVTIHFPPERVVRSPRNPPNSATARG